MPVLRIDQNGNLIWGRLYDSSDIRIWGNGLRGLNDTTLIVLGTTGQGTNHDFAILSLDGDGNINGQSS